MQRIPTARPHAVEDREVEGGEPCVALPVFRLAQHEPGALERVTRVEGASVDSVHDLAARTDGLHQGADAEGPLTDLTRNFQRDANGRVILGANGSPLVKATNALEVSKLTLIARGAKVD